MQSAPTHPNTGVVIREIQTARKECGETDRWTLELYFALAYAQARSGKREPAASRIRKALGEARAVKFHGDAFFQIRALMSAGGFMFHIGELAEAEAAFREAEEVLARWSHASPVALFWENLLCLGFVLALGERIEEASEIHELAVRLDRRLAYPPIQPIVRLHGELLALTPDERKKQANRWRNIAPMNFHFATVVLPWHG